MSLSGKMSTEVRIHASAAKWFNFFSSQLHHIQNIAERIHCTKLHQGHDWHASDSVKHWSYTIDGKVVTSQERIESVDEQNKRIIFKLFGEDIEKQFKVFNLIFKATDKNDGVACIKWTIEYERKSEDAEPPYGYIEFCNKCVKDIDAHLLQAEELNESYKIN
ncbi:MLP-like protein 34 [Cajanus cajan]|uniref:MLP-like protein 43 n=1 Tax=Cajanus cajan TaxID=3821 RepID=A0A151SFR7_CAJCA|nr:MLP-like protein 34 [Cajanus cajan]KYP53551.1 MLP-like protein 43 [Cajanus cajan]